MNTDPQARYPNAAPSERVVSHEPPSSFAASRAAADLRHAQDRIKHLERELNAIRRGTVPRAPLDQSAFKDLTAMMESLCDDAEDVCATTLKLMQAHYVLARAPHDPETQRRFARAALAYRTQLSIQASQVQAFTQVYARLGLEDTP